MLTIRRIHIIMFSYFVFLFFYQEKTFEEKIPEITYEVYKKQQYKKVALTFDDGPHPYFTQKIVEILQINNIKATFFLVGKQVEKYPELVRCILDHSDSKLANHTYSHKNLTKLLNSEIKEELKKTQDILNSIAKIQYQDRVIPYFRPPGGNYNSRVLAVAEELGLKVALWSIFTNDHLSSTTKQEILNNIASSLSLDEEIILLHSGSPQTLEALQDIINLLKEKNYEFVTIDEILTNETDIVNRLRQSEDWTGYIR